MGPGRSGAARSKGRFSSRGCRGSVAHTRFRTSAFRTVRQYMSVILSPRICGDLLQRA